MPNPQIQSLTVNGTTYDIVDNTSGYMDGMTILSYGSSTWQDFIDAYSENKVVYCRASSQSNPATGDQTRLAFMAYVNNPSNPTSVEFQYYRSVSTHTATQQGDQVFVYTLTSAGNWSVTTREASVKVAAGGDLTGSYSNGTYTVSGTIPDVSGLAPLASPAFTGTPTAPTPTSGDDSTKIATTAFVQDAMSAAGAGTVTSVAVSNATNGGLSVSGSPITSSGTISIGHSNVLTNAQTTQAVYPITIDKNGHISAYGSAVTIPVVPSATDSATTGITISDHATSSITGVQSSTTTASKVTLGTAISVPNVTAVGSGSFTQGAFDGGSFTQGIDSFTANTPTAINTSKFNGGSFTSGTFTAGSLTMAMDTTDTKQLNITFTAPTHGADSFTSASLASGFYTAGTAASFTQGTDSFTPATHGADSHTHTAPTLGTAISVPNVTGATDVTVPIKNTSSTTVVTGKTHTITDNGHTHSLG